MEMSEVLPRCIVQGCGREPSNNGLGLCALCPTYNPYTVSADKKEICIISGCKTVRSSRNDWGFCDSCLPGDNPITVHNPNLQKPDSDGRRLGWVWRFTRIQGIPHCVTNYGAYQVDAVWLYSHSHMWREDEEEEEVVGDGE